MSPMASVGSSAPGGSHGAPAASVPPGRAALGGQIASQSGILSALAAAARRLVRDSTTARRQAGVVSLRRPGDEGQGDGI